MAAPIEAGFKNTGQDFQFYWGGYCFMSRPTKAGNPPVTHAIGIHNLSMSQACAPKIKTNTQGYYYAVRTHPQPTKISFSLTYVRGMVNQQIHRLVDFWKEKLGQAKSTFFGGINPVNEFFTGIFIFSDLKVRNIQVLPMGDWASCTLDFEFTEEMFIPAGYDLTGVESAIDVGA